MQSFRAESKNGRYRLPAHFDFAQCDNTVIMNDLILSLTQFHTEPNNKNLIRLIKKLIGIGIKWIRLIRIYDLA